MSLRPGDHELSFAIRSGSEQDEDMRKAIVQALVQLGASYKSGRAPPSSLERMMQELLDLISSSEVASSSALAGWLAADPEELEAAAFLHGLGQTLEAP